MDRNKCIYCGQTDVDGGYDGMGNFMCIDCIAENPEANSRLESMAPAQWYWKIV